MRRIGILQGIVANHQATEIEGYLVDAMTASALVAIYEALSPANQEKFDSIPLPKLVDFAWKHVTPAI